MVDAGNFGALRAGDLKKLAGFLAILRAAGVSRWKFPDGTEVELGALPPATAAVFDPTAPVGPTPPGDPQPEPGALELIMRARRLEAVG